MIRGFENETQMITQFERDCVVPHIMYILSNRKGKSNAITVRGIQGLLLSLGFRVPDVRVRRCIKFIQINNLVQWIVSYSGGFYFTDKISDVMDQIKSLENRECAIKLVRSALQESLEKSLN